MPERLVHVPYMLLNLPQGQRYPICVILMSLNPKFHSTLLCFETSAPNDPQMILATIRSKVRGPYMCHWSSVPEPRISLSFALCMVSRF